MNFVPENLNPVAAAPCGFLNAFAIVLSSSPFCVGVGTLHSGVADSAHGPDGTVFPIIIALFCHQIIYLATGQIMALYHLI